MDIPTTELSTLAPLLSEQIGIAVLFGFAIWAGVAVLRLWIGAQRDIELARVAVQKDLSEAIRAQAVAGTEQAAAVRDLRSDVAAQAIVLRMLAGRAGLVETRNGGE